MSGPKFASEGTPLLRDDDACDALHASATQLRDSIRQAALTIDRVSRSSPGFQIAPLFPSADDRALAEVSGQPAVSHLEPRDALTPLVKGGAIVAAAGYWTTARPASGVKSIPAFAPFRRTERHRSFALWWINEFRHWWKSRYTIFVRSQLDWTALVDSYQISHIPVFLFWNSLMQPSVGAVGRALHLGLFGGLCGEDAPGGALLKYARSRCCKHASRSARC